MGGNNEFFENLSTNIWKNYPACKELNSYAFTLVARKTRNIGDTNVSFDGHYGTDKVGNKDALLPVINNYLNIIATHCLTYEINYY